MSFFTSTIDYLLHRNKPLEHDNSKSIARIKSADNPSHLAVVDGDGSSVSKYVQMDADAGQKRTSTNIYQHMATYMQFQEEAIKYAQILYDEMARLAVKAADPTTSSAERSALATQFEELRQVALNLNHETYKDAFLFEERASSTDFAEDAEWKLQWASDKGSGGTTQTKDVIYSEGKISLRVNSGNRGEKYELIQGDPDGEHVVLFDSGNWKTKGEAYNHDFDEFIIEWGREKDTTFYSPTDSTNDKVDTPKGDATPYWITPTEGAPEVEDANNQKDDLGRNLWIGSTYVAEEFSTEDSENGVYGKFDIISEDDKLWLLVDDSVPVTIPESSNLQWQEITFAGDWQTAGHSVGQIVSHNGEFWLLVEDSTTNPAPNLNQPEWQNVESELVSFYANLKGQFNTNQNYSIGDIVSSTNSGQQGKFWLLTGTQSNPPIEDIHLKNPYNDTGAWLELSKQQSDSMLQYWTFSDNNWNNFLWDGDHNWVQYNGSLRQALFTSDEVDPALHSYKDLYKARSPNPNDATKATINDFNLEERAAVFEILDQDGSPILEFTADDDELGSSINDYTFEINTNQSLKEAQAAVIDFEGVELTAKTAGFEGNKIVLRVNAEDFRRAKIEASGLLFTAKTEGDPGNANEVQIIESKQATANIGGVEVEIKDTFLVGENGNDFNPTNDDIIIGEDFLTQSSTTIGGVTVTIIAKDGNPLGAAGDGTKIVVDTNTQAFVEIGSAKLTVKPSTAHGAESNDIQIEVKESQSSAATLNLLGLNLSVKEVGTGGNDIKISVTENDSTVTGIVYDEGAGTLKFENALTTYNLGQLAAEFTFPESNIFNVEAPTDSTINLSGAATDEFITAGGDGSKDITYNLNGSTHQILLPHSYLDYNTNAERRKEFEDGVNNLADITNLFDVDVTSSTTPIGPDPYKTAGGLGSTPTGQIHYDNSSGHKIWLPADDTFDSEDLFNALNNDTTFTTKFDINLDPADKATTFSDDTFNFSGGEGSGSVEARYDAGLNQLIIELPNSLEDEKQEDIATAINSGTGGRFSAQATNLTADASDSWDTDFANGVGTDSLVYVEDLAGNPTGTIYLAGGPGADNSVQTAIDVFNSSGSAIFQSVEPAGGGLVAGTYKNDNDTKGLTNSEIFYTAGGTNNPLLTLRQGLNSNITHQMIIDAVSGGKLTASSNTPAASISWPTGLTNTTTYASYQSKGTVHDQAKLNTNLGRDAEKVRYTEDSSTKKVTIDISGDSATPNDILLAYEAWRNKQDNGPNVGNRSVFKTPVILDENGRNTSSITASFRIGGVSVKSTSDSVNNENSLEVVHNTQASVDIGGLKLTVKGDLAHGEDSNGISIEVLDDIKGSGGAWTSFYNKATNQILLPFEIEKYDAESLAYLLQQNSDFANDFDIEFSDSALSTGSFITTGGEGITPSGEINYESSNGHKIWLPSGGDNDSQALKDFLESADMQNNNAFWTAFGIDKTNISLNGPGDEKLVDITQAPAARLKLEGKDAAGSDSAASQLDGNRGSEASPLSTNQGQVISKTSNPTIVDSSKLTLRVTPGETDPDKIDDSFQAVVHYTPPEKLDEKTFGDQSELGGTMLSLGLGLLRFGEEVDDRNLKGKAISIESKEHAEKALLSLAREIEDLAKQVNRLGENYTKTSFNLEHFQNQYARLKDLSTHSPEDVITEEAIRMEEIQILRDYHISLLHKVMRVDEDMVRMLILK